MGGVGGVCIDKASDIGFDKIQGSGAGDSSPGLLGSRAEVTLSPWRAPGGGGVSSGNGKGLESEA